MKKLTLSLILGLSSVSLSSGAYVGGSNAANMNITAEVMKPATISTVQDLEFGKIIAGFDHQETQAGKFNIKYGESTAPNITYSYGGESLDVTNGEGNVNIELKNGTNSLPVSLSIKKGAISQESGENTMDILVRGIAKPIATQATGEYSGILTARISYN